MSVSTSERLRVLELLRYVATSTMSSIRASYPKL